MTKPETPTWPQFESRHRTLMAYLLDKAQERDWHGVSDAANDLRCLEVEMRLRAKTGA